MLENGFWGVVWVVGIMLHAWEASTDKMPSKSLSVTANLVWRIVRRLHTSGSGAITMATFTTRERAA